MKTEQALSTLGKLYDLIDRQVEALTTVHGDRLQCRQGCSGCCQDDLTIFEVEAAHIRDRHADLLATEPPGAAGACAFLNAKGDCRIYEHRPYVCRTQGLPLRWIDERPDGTPVEMRDICPLNEIGPPVEIMETEHCWTIGPFEEALAELQSQLDGGELRRVAMRGMFGTEPGRQESGVRSQKTDGGNQPAQDGGN
jgi:hypothetical protein